ncbi:MAG: serine hydrolase [Actinobacteria bacterium]|nr:serine hydrolase [Actinomycetota bacterium]
MKDSDPIGIAMQGAVSEGVFPGAVLLVRLRGAIRYHAAFGSTALIPAPQRTTVDTLYDLASLTKPLATVTAVLLLIQEHAVSLDDLVEHHMPELRGTDAGQASLYHLLNHSSGLPAWRPLYECLDEDGRVRRGELPREQAIQTVVSLIGQEALIYPRGSRSVYSDLGFILLGIAIERVTGRSLDAFCRTRMYDVLGATPLSFRPLQSTAVRQPTDPSGIAATEKDSWRGRVLRGEVHDENAFALGGVAGHAGLFGTAMAVSVLTTAWLRASLGSDNLLKAELARKFVTRQEQTPGSSWGLGWDTPSPPSSAGSRFSSHSFGHLGYTGTSIWIDRKSEMEVILLSNRVHPTRNNTAIQRFRPLIHDQICQELMGGNERDQSG